MQFYRIVLILLASLHASQVCCTMGPPVLHCSSDSGPAHFHFSIPPSARDKIVLIEGPTQYFLLQWVRGYVPLKMHDTFDRIDGLTSEAESISFSLKDVSPQDRGNYTCREGVRNGPIIPDCGQTLIYISELPRPAASQGQLAVEGGTAYLICFDNIPNQWAECGLRFSYNWTKDGVPLEGQHLSTIRFSPLSASDQGLYSCQVRESSRNCGVSPASLPHSFNVAVPPRVSIHSPANSTDIHIAEGQPLTLTCEVKDAIPRVPEDGFSWTFSPSSLGAAGQQHHKHHKHQHHKHHKHQHHKHHKHQHQYQDQHQQNQQQLPETGDTLSLGSVDRHRGGQYTCQARNDQNLGGNIPPGSASVHVHVFVRHLGNMTLTPDEVKVKEGDDITLTCTVECSPTAHLQWRVNGEPRRDVTANVDRYVVVMATPEHSGNYECRASNGESLSLESSTSVTVLARPVVSITPEPNLTLENLEAQEQVGDEAATHRQNHLLATGLAVLSFLVTVAAEENKRQSEAFLQQMKEV